jgi:exosome complex RNA-binding protein Rrp4
VLKQVVLQAVATAKAAVQDLAIPCQLIQKSMPTHVPGTAPSSTPVTHDVKIIHDKFETKEIDGERVRASDHKVLIFPETGQPVPETNDVITGDIDKSGVKSYRVINNDKVMAGDTVALSQVQLRL